MAVAWPRCYHGGVTKKECEQLLGKKAKEGAFLLRDSETVDGGLCLCVYKQDIVYTYRVMTSGRRYSLIAAEGVPKVYFSNLQELIVHYRKKDQGLATHLRFSVCRVTPLCIKPKVLQDPESAMETEYENSYATYVTVLP
ncbi:SH2 domain-containing protein 1B [Gadus macrocephalus]|uniref:SH2 domain-containing protein 1B n=1 Tax=Gadus macrocephalus TaxID=80720 RepID=UPI0028CB520E|nr:SH2 domain-containing protein 1B [Gadus macrocephalus]